MSNGRWMRWIGIACLPPAVWGCGYDVGRFTSERAWWIGSRATVPGYSP
jgi:hypothetical protein